MGCVGFVRGMSQKKPMVVFIDALNLLIAEGEIGRTAELAGLSRETLSRWRSGSVKINPRLETLVKLATVLKVPVEDLISDPIEREALALQKAQQEIRQLRRKLERIQGVVLEGKTEGDTTR